jgi:hypothetical protein
MCCLNIPAGAAGLCPSPWSACSAADVGSKVTPGKIKEKKE